MTLVENESENKYSSYTVYIVLMIVAFIIFTRITIYFVYYNWYWSLIKNNVSCIKFNTHKETKIWWMQFYWTYKWEKSEKLTLKNRTYYFYKDQNDLKNFDAKIDKKDYKRHWHLLHWLCGC